ncbi:MAG: RNA 2',3'-cyclic phosphodiesterase [Pseudomonadales bacterium]
MRIRTFFALRLHDSVVRQLADHADSLCEYDRKLEVDWVDSDQYHLTLCFLGDTALDQIELLEELAKQQLKDELSFQVCLEKVNYYEISKNLSLIAALPSENKALRSLQKSVANMVTEAGIKSDLADFKPHITLGKLPNQNELKHPKQWPELNLHSLADSVVLLQSKPGEHGSVYTPLFEIDLQDLA